MIPRGSEPHQLALKDIEPISPRSPYGFEGSVEDASEDGDEDVSEQQWEKLSAELLRPLDGSESVECARGRAEESAEGAKDREKPQGPVALSTRCSTLPSTLNKGVVKLREGPTTTVIDFNNPHRQSMPTISEGRVDDNIAMAQPQPQPRSRSSEEEDNDTNPFRELC